MVTLPNLLPLGIGVPLVDNGIMPEAVVYSEANDEGEGVVHHIIA